MMKNRILALVLTFCLVLSLAACSSGGSGSAAQEPAAAEEAPGNNELSDAQKALAEAEAALAGSEARNAAPEPGELNEYGLTNQALQELADTIRENVTEDYLNVYDISPAGFVWPDANAYFWGETRFVMQQLSNFEFTSEPPETINNLSEEDNALARAMMYGIYEWVQAGGDFDALYENALSDGNDVSAEKAAQFLADNVTFE